MRKLAAGNWKMNGLGPDLDEARSLAEKHLTPGCDVVICPPATLLHRMATALSETSVAVGGQDCHAAASGAHTGDISAQMLAEAGGSYVILGHSERRTDHGESDADVEAKVRAARSADLIPIVCVGETLEQRETGSTLEIVGAQLKGSVPDGLSSDDLVIAYEPVWAIGTGKVPSTDQIAEVHAFVREHLVERMGDDGHQVRILYGGSVKAANAGDIFAVPHVDGALVGGASLKAREFSGIVSALETA